MLRRDRIGTGHLATAALVVATAVSALAQTAQQPPAPGQRGVGGGRGPATPPLVMTTTAWEDGGGIPDKYTQDAAATRTAVVNAMDGHVLGKAVLVGRFHR